MRKILNRLILLCFAFTTGYANNTQSNSEKNKKINQLTRGAKLTDLIESPNDKWIAFVKKSNFVVSKNCSYFFSKGDHADEIWIVNTEKMTKKLLVPPHFTCGDVTKLIIDPHHLRFSPDSSTLYFETSAWVTSGAVHAVNVDGKHERFVTDGTELRIVQTGSYKGDLIVNQHRYHDKGGSYNWDWLFTPAGKQIKLYKKGDD